VLGQAGFNNNSKKKKTDYVARKGTHTNMFTFMHFNTDPSGCNLEMGIDKEKEFSPSKQTK
jgi:hypothetical protein